MARYKEVWADWNDDTVTSILDTETGWSFSPDSRRYAAYQEWLDEGNAPDPAFTADEIAAFEAAEADVAAAAFLAATDWVLPKYLDDMETKGRSTISSTKAKRLRRDRNRARRRIGTAVPSYTEPDED